MFQTAKAFGSFAVDDLATAQKFYGETLGLQVSEEDGALMLHLAGDHRILVYPKPDHSPASFTILNFPVDDIDQAVDELTARGVPIRRYEGFQTDARGIYRGQGHSIAWFTDPGRQRPVGDPGSLSGLRRAPHSGLNDDLEADGPCGRHQLHSIETTSTGSAKPLSMTERSPVAGWVGARAAVWAVARISPPSAKAPTRAAAFTPLPR